mgnify:CR=1 FL=1
MTVLEGMKYIRVDLGGNTCVHADLVDGQVGFSVREEGASPSRPPVPDFWLSPSKLLKLQDITSQLVLSPETPTPHPVRESSSPFFQVNIDAILKHQVGLMKKPPWWLRWLYSAVVTKERHGL